MQTLFEIPAGREATDEEWAEMMAQVAREEMERETMEQEWHRDCCPRHGNSDREWHQGCPCDGSCSCDLGDLKLA